MQTVLQQKGSNGGPAIDESEKRRRREEAARIRELRQGVTLGPDLTIRDLINEGRRVMSCLMSLVAGSQVIAMFVAGPVAEKAGIPNLYYGGAAMLVGIGIIGHFKLPRTVKAKTAEAG